MTRQIQQPDSSLDKDSSLRRGFLRRWWIGVVIALLLAGPSVIHSAAAIATLRNVPDQWLPQSLPLKRDFTDFIARFGLSDILFVSWTGATLDNPDVDQVTRLLRAVSSETSDESLDQMVTADSTSWQREFIDNVKSLGPTATPIRWVRSGTEIRDSLTDPPLSSSESAATARLFGTLIGPDRKQTCVLISLGESSGRSQRQLLPMMRAVIAKTIDRPVAEVVMVGGSVDGVAVDNESIASIERFTVPSSILAAVLCWLCLRSLPLTFTILGIATIGQGMVLAAVYYIGMPMNAILIVLPPLIFVLTVSAGIHLSNYFLDFARESEPLDWRAKTAAAQRAMSVGVPPCLVATFTTVVGLMSLCLVRLQPVRLFGLIGALGVLGTLAMLILMLPGAMLMTKPSTVRRTETSESKLPRRSTFGRSPWFVIAGFMILACAASIGLGRLETSVSVTGMFLPGSELRQNYVWYEKNVGATMTADLLLSYGDDTAAKDLSGDDAINQLRQVIRLHSAVLKLPEVGGVMSAVTFLPIPSRSGSLAATAQRSVIRRVLADDESQIASLGYVDHSNGQRTWRISMRLFQIGDTNFSDAIERIRETAQQSVAKNIFDKTESLKPELTMTGHVVIVDGTQQLLLSDLFSSFLAAFGIIAVLMVIYLRSFIGGVLAMIPNVIPTLLLFGSMGWLRQPLDIGSVMTASVALGIAVDDSVHLLSQYRTAVAQSISVDGIVDRPAAAATALRHCGWAMLQTTVVCSLSLLVYGLSPFVPTRRFALFMLGLLAVAWVGVSILLPAIMATRLGRFLCRSIGSSLPMSL